MKILIKSWLTIGTFIFSELGLSAQVVKINVGSESIHTMKGGIGASWQAISTTGIYYQKEKVFSREGRRARGSGWGANPPSGYNKQWNQLKDYWKWLGMSFSRVELDMRMYCPKKGVYDWDNEEMRTLYRILDICEELKVDVFLTQMWQDVQWNAIDGVSLLQSAPKSEKILLMPFVSCWNTWSKRNLKPVSSISVWSTSRWINGDGGWARMESLKL